MLIMDNVPQRTDRPRNPSSSTRCETGTDVSELLKELHAEDSMADVRECSKDNGDNARTLYFDDLALGQAWVTEERRVTAQDVERFASLTGDCNPIHVDPDFARTTPFKRCIAHGLLGVSLAGAMVLTAPRLQVIALIGIEEWKFIRPIFVGDVIRVRQSVAGLETKGRGRRGSVRWQLEVLTADDRVVQSGVSVLLVAARGDRKGEEFRQYANTPPHAEEARI
jgi:3-hydroxybutyryl-CoA dehydratase